MSNNFKKIIEKVTGSIDEKKEWKRYLKRIGELPKDYKNAMEGIQTYMMHFAGGSAMIEVLYGLLELFEVSVAEGKRVTDVVGNDLGAFCEDIIKTVPEVTWMDSYKKKMQDKVNKKMSD